MEKVVGELFERTEMPMEMSMGNMYEVNKQLGAKDKPLSKSKLREVIDEIKIFMARTDNNYYMLLCRERYDYTVFKTNKTIFGNEYNAKVMVEEVACARGKVTDIFLTEDKSAYEIWITIDDEAYCYYFFPCDTCVIDEV